MSLLGYALFLILSYSIIDSYKEEPMPYVGSKGEFASSTMNSPESNKKLAETTTIICPMCGTEYESKTKPTGCEVCIQKAKVRLKRTLDW